MFLQCAAASSDLHSSWSFWRLWWSWSDWSAGSRRFGLRWERWWSWPGEAEQKVFPPGGNKRRSVHAKTASQTLQNLFNWTLGVLSGFSGFVFCLQQRFFKLSGNFTTALSCWLLCLASVLSCKKNINCGNILNLLHQKQRKNVFFLDYLYIFKHRSVVYHFFVENIQSQSWEFNRVTCSSGCRLEWPSQSSGLNTKRLRQNIIHTEQH